MKDFKLIENTNNLEVTNHDFVFTDSDSEYVAQKLRMKLSIFEGEWYLDNTLGLPYFETIFVKNPNLDLIEDLYKIAIFEVDEVEEITEFSMIVEKSIRDLELDFRVRLVTGEIVSVVV